ncbi:divalent-cation tolerance protein CutA [Phycicoccus flavus]|uniref:divalent-cation tolerance protein CutA n=1 Tax=Phycicoccus flavus TaxID=2502783 RepID=UPI000FEBFEAC|nr:divalent-cation tolerance protein CutA [Phycicoccus flavus]NHA67482.1 divalent-cation tolerance protein CutA [Phycicoccus flavus]
MSGRDAEHEDGDALVEVHVTTPDRESALRIARVLVGEGLAACAQVVPGVTSVYVWDGAVQEDDEHLLLVKSTAARFGAIRERVGAEHPYDTPEVLAVPVTDSDTRYASWVRDTVRPEDTAGPL